jgi:predicted AAA+ superfamily ATPase
MLNKTDLAAPLGVSVPTISQWLNILETTAQILLVPPFYESFGQRPVKSPKLHFVDSGLACHLLNINSERELSRSPFLEPLVEGFVASEIVKHQLHEGRRKEIYYFRDHQGLEIDSGANGAGKTIFSLPSRRQDARSPWRSRQWTGKPTRSSAGDIQR